MAYSDVKASFLGILNRNDLTPSLADQFMKLGARRIDRELRVPAMEKLWVYPADGGFSLPVPNDFLELISLNTNDPVNNDRLVRTNLQDILRLSACSGVPKKFYRQGNQFIIGPKPLAGTNIFLSYYADSGSLAADTDSNWLTDAAPDLLTYAALTRAADYFLDERKQLFEGTYQDIAASLNVMAQQDELANASIGACYDTNVGWPY